MEEESETNSVPADTSHTLQVLLFIFRSAILYVTSESSSYSYHIQVSNLVPLLLHCTYFLDLIENVLHTQFSHCYYFAIYLFGLLQLPCIEEIRGKLLTHKVTPGDDDDLTEETRGMMTEVN